MAKLVMVVDDEESMVHLLRTILEARGYEVATAAGGAEALTLVHDRRPDLMLLDLMMPGMDGWEVLHELRQDPSTADIPVIIITVKRDELDRTVGTDLLKVEGYVNKPFVRKELVELVRRTLGE
jgi:CheY-like chemotaxis protein